MKKWMQLDGGPPGSFEQATLVRLEASLVTRRRRLERWNDIRDVIVLEIDSLVLMLLVGIVLLPVFLLALGDLSLVVLYALAMAGGAFILFLLALRGAESRVARLRANVRALEAEMAELKKARRPARI